MNIYFTASVTGKKDYAANYEEIVRVIKDLGHKVYTFINLISSGDNRALESLDKRVEIHKKLMQEISKCDLLIAEASYPSINVGYEITTALDKEKPVLVLHVSGRVPVLLLGAEYDRLRTVEYSMNDIKKILNMYIDELSETVDTRFNFFISPKHQNYLDWVAKKLRIPRAVHLRKLLERDMAANKNYQVELSGEKSSKK